MSRRAGLQTEVLVSLALVMLAAGGVLALVVRAYDEARVREVLVRALTAEARAPGPPARSLYPGIVWWRIDERDQARAWGPIADRLDEPSWALARVARERRATVLRPGMPWESIRFATQLEDGSVAVARLPREASGSLRAVPMNLLAGLLALDAAVFTAFGVWLLRRRILLPLRRVGEAARMLAAGDLRGRVPEEGARETAELARHFNEMGEALEVRNEALEKAVADLRAANHELHETQEGLDRAQRLASVGHLAAGVAHEVGNPMGAMLAFIDLALRDRDTPPQARDHLERAAQQGGRVRTILRQLLDFSRPTEGRIQPVDVAACAEEAAQLVRAQRSYAGIDLEVRRDACVPRALADPGVLGQVLLNLLLNAGDALRDRPGGRIEVRVGSAVRRRRAGDDAGLSPSRDRADAVACEVCDDGPGIPEADRARIFDPFFTTKDPGQGTGLGLANVHRLVETMAGRVDLVSPGPLGGACFRITLPAVPAAGTQAVRNLP
jgi:signal transduction histidine kinase